MSAQQALADKLRAALLRYEQMGEQAVALLAAQGAEAFLEKLRRREQVFRNLAALDALARHKGFDMAQDPQARSIWQRIELCNQSLAQLIEQAKIHLGDQLVALTRAERQLRIYHSHSEPPVRLVKHI